MLTLKISIFIYKLNLVSVIGGEEEGRERQEEILFSVEFPVSIG